MPKQAKSSTAKVREICRQYPNEFEATPAGDLRCKLCEVLVKCDKKVFAEGHRKSKLHQGKLVTTSSFQGKQTYLQLDQAYFKEKVVSSFLAALHKLNHPALKSLFAAMGKSLPSATAARASVAQIASQKRRIFENYFGTKKFF